MKLITRREHLKDENTQYTTSLSDDIELLLSNGIRPQDILISTDRKYAYCDAHTAVTHKTKLLLNGQTVDTKHNKSAFERSLFFYSVASNKIQEEDALYRCKSLVLDSYPLKLSLSDIGNLIESSLVDPKKKEVLFNQIKQYIREQEHKIKQHHSFVSHPAIIVDERSLDKVDDLNATGYINFLATGTGSGKTIKMRQEFERCESDKLHAMWMNGSRALTEAFCGADSQHYNKQWNQDTYTGVYGVALTLLLNSRYDNQRNKTKAVFIDEIEHVFDLLTSNLVGTGSAEDRSLAVSNMKQLISNTDFTVVADAFPSKHSIETLVDIARASNKKVRIFTSCTKATKPRINVIHEADNIQRCKSALLSGDKRFVFCDAKHSSGPSKFNAIYKAICDDIPVEQWSSVKIDAEFAGASSVSELAEPNSLAEKYNMMFVNSTVLNGLSITHADYQNASLLLNYTNSPTDVCQVKHRARNVKTVDLSFPPHYQKQSATTNTTEVLYDLVSKCLKSDTQEFTKERFDKALQSEELIWIANRLAFKNEARQHYAFSLLTMLKQQGHELDIKITKSSNSNQLKGYINQEHNEFITTIVKAVPILADEVDSLKNAQHLSRTDEARLIAHKLKNALNRTTLDFETVNQCIKLKLLTLIEKYSLAFSVKQPKTLHDAIQAKIYQDVLTLSLENNAFCSLDTATKVLDYRSDGEVIVGGQKFRVINHFDKLLYMPSKRPNIATTRKFLLSNFGIELNDKITKRTTSPKDRVWKKAELTELLYISLTNLEISKYLDELTNKPFDK
ncbi:hypothetical protein VCRA2117O37_10183 [Vibrio crassostreae]|nr:hypothetical protein VCHA42O253_40106 [Vibrio chagasii]CAK1862379.1 hypothetical protein VCRA2117O37_10183 [Vibrio crassostreae]CAK1862968.1 hypothetical protein VCRA2116O31_10182 [Vibrio crassostreae]CAK2311428.1 hypothetical protein VCRA2119O51_10182 [Vibrio crassostreae]CAK2673087.1 hypothetical protein VCRA2113O25_10332 [Vibrio crassostreae]